MLFGNHVAYTNICPGRYLFNQCGGDVPIVKQWSGRKAILNLIIPRSLLRGK